jgi:hypothetical protein
MKIRVYDMVINDNDETGVDINSFVDAPAHTRSFETYGKKQKATFAVDDEKRIVTGVFIMADHLIYRNDKQLGEHFVKFKPEVIWQIRNKFFKNGFNVNTNVQHETMVEGAILVDSFIVHSTDPRFPKVPEILAKQKVNDGSWVGSYYIENDQLWQDCKNGIFTGFSVEGYFDKVEAKVRTGMSKNKTRVTKGRFGEVAQVSKWYQTVDQNTFEVGTKLTTSWTDHEGNTSTSPLSAGEYTTETGSQILVDSNGTIRLVYSKQSKTTNMSKSKKNSLFKNIFGAAATEEFGQATTVDGTVIFWEGELAVGTSVLIEVDGAKVAAPEGDHQVDIDGKTFVVTLDAEGKVTSMTEVTAMSEEAEILSAAIKKVVDDASAKFAAQQAEIDKLKADLQTAQAGGKFSASGKKSGEGDNKGGFRSILN